MCDLSGISSLFPIFGNVPAYINVAVFWSVCPAILVVVQGISKRCAYRLYDSCSLFSLSAPVWSITIMAMHMTVLTLGFRRLFWRITEVRRIVITTRICNDLLCRYFVRSLQAWLSNVLFTRSRSIFAIVTLNIVRGSMDWTVCLAIHSEWMRLPNEFFPSPYLRWLRLFLSGDARRYWKLPIWVPYSSPKHSTGEGIQTCLQRSRQLCLWSFRIIWSYWTWPFRLFKPTSRQQDWQTRNNLVTGAPLWFSYDRFRFHSLLHSLHDFDIGGPAFLRTLEVNFGWCFTIE